MKGAGDHHPNSRRSSRSSTKWSISDSNVQQSAERPPLIVGIGASAGGLAAFEAFFANMPADSGMAFVLVQHLDPHHKSMLVDLLANYTEMPVLPKPYMPGEIRHAIAAALS
jgi:chemotaxis response regulator CheB